MQLPEINTAEVAQRLAEAIRYRTISHQVSSPEAQIQESEQAFVDFRDWLAKTYPSFSGVAKREVVGDYSLLFTWQGTDTSLEPILLMSHIDVVPVDAQTESTWEHEPFSGALADGYVWGRGALDTKGSLVAILEAAERLIKEGHKPRRTILFAFGHDEETDRSRRMAPARPRDARVGLLQPGPWRARRTALARPRGARVGQLQFGPRGARRTATTRAPRTGPPRHGGTYPSRVLKRGRGGPLAYDL